MLASHDGGDDDRYNDEEKEEKSLTSITSVAASVSSVTANPSPIPIELGFVFD